MVTAAGSGIGRETALLCARLGAALALCDLDEEGLQSTARAANALGAEVLIERLDVADPERMGVFAARVHERFDTVELLVNNTDMGVIATFLDTELSDWRYLAMAILRAVGHDRAVAVGDGARPCQTAGALGGGIQRHHPRPYPPLAR